VIRTRDDDQLLGGGGLFVEAPALLHRNDAVAGTGNHEEWCSHLAHLRHRVELVAQQPSDRQDRIVNLADRGHRRERGAQDQRRRRVLRREPDRDGRTQRLAEVGQAVRIDVGSREQVAACGAGIRRQAGLGRAAGIVAEAAIVEQQNRTPGCAQRFAKLGAKSAITGVAIEHDDREPRRLAGAPQKPAVQAQAIIGGERDRLRVL
jgi:hypothetical protein